MFAWHANPLLEAYFGTEALLATYVTLAVAAGILTYVLLRRLDYRLATTSSAEETTDSPGTTVTVVLVRLLSYHVGGCHSGKYFITLSLVVDIYRRDCQDARTGTIRGGT